LQGNSNSELYSLFVASSHNFIYPHFYIKNIKMPTLITQEEGPPDILPTSNLTMAILPNVAKKKFVQRSFYFGRMTQPMMAAPPQETKQVPAMETKRIIPRPRTPKRKNRHQNILPLPA
jgi:hypothetical protein